jgi:hypothetical protein
MRAVVIILIGLVLLAAWLLVTTSVSRVGRRLSGPPARVRRGVVRGSGDQLLDGRVAGRVFLSGGLPIFLVIIGIPAALAVFAGRRLR